MFKNYLYNLLVIALLHVAASKVDNGFSSNQVQIQFDLVEPEMWTVVVTNTFKEFIADSVGTYCVNNLTCGMLNYRNFTAENVEIVGDLIPEYVNTVLEFAVRLPEPDATSQDGNLYIQRLALIDVVTDSRVELQQQLLAASNIQFEFAFRVSFVDGVLVLPESSQTLNKIITPITCAAVLVLMLIVIGFEIKQHFQQNKKLKTAREKALLNHDNVLDNSSIHV